VRSIRHFVVEEIRTARRFLKAVDRNIDIDALTFYEMGKHADPSRFASFLRPLREGQDVGVISEAGCPAVACVPPIHPRAPRPYDSQPAQGRAQRRAPNPR